MKREDKREKKIRNYCYVDTATIVLEKCETNQAEYIRN